MPSLRCGVHGPRMSASSRVRGVLCWNITRIQYHDVFRYGLMRDRACQTSQCVSSGGGTNGSQTVSPFEVVEQVLTALRKGTDDAVADFMHSSHKETVDEWVRYRSERLQMEDGGVLSRFAFAFCVGSRRLLPSNLLRRSRVLSALSPSGNEYQIRMLVSSKSGEEGVVVWDLRLEGDGQACEQWKVFHVAREQAELQPEFEAPVTPHPRVSPESIMMGHIMALMASDFHQANAFCARLPFGEEEKECAESNLMLNPYVFSAMACTLREHPYSILTKRSEIVLGEGLLVSQKYMVQELFLKELGKPKAQWHRFLWHIKLQKHACWMIDKVDFKN